MGLKNKEILIIDDDPSIRMLVKKILSNVGITVFDVSGVDDGVKIAKHRFPHLVILDIKLDNESGYKFLEIRSSDEKLKKIPVLVLSSVKGKKYVDRALSFESVDYLLKPLNSNQLLQKLKKIIGGSAGKKKYFEDDEMVDVNLTFPGILKSINEVSCIISSPAKVGKDCEIEIESKQFKELGLSSLKMKSNKQSVFDSGGYYNSHIMFLGITEEQARSIRKIKWKK